MATPKQITANGANAAHSTGPKTPAGRARSSKNALRHGLRSDLPVLPGERAEDWQAHHDGILRSLAPAGTLEQCLAERVALCLWRPQRVAAYETGVTAVGLMMVTFCERMFCGMMNFLQVIVLTQPMRSLSSLSGLRVTLTFLPGGSLRH